MQVEHVKRPIDNFVQVFISHQVAAIVHSYYYTYERTVDTGAFSPISQMGLGSLKGGLNVKEIKKTQC